MMKNYTKEVKQVNESMVELIAQIKIYMEIIEENTQKLKDTICALEEIVE